MGLFSWIRKLFGRADTGVVSQSAVLQQVLQSLGDVGWYYERNGQRVGPFSLIQLQQLMNAGQLRPDDLVFRNRQQGIPLSALLPGSAPAAPTRGAPVPATGPSTSTRPATPPVAQTLDLDAADFLPIVQSELKEQAKDVERLAAFGLRDRIPPADDPRTKLIDRALVTHGLLSPEQLVEIHTVGADMERVRPHVVTIETRAYRSGEDAVQAEKARRARLKEEKKAAAAKRKKERADAIAQRKATDIIFLGRGVSRRLNERTSDVARLAAQGLPLLATPAELAAALGLTIPRLRWLAFHTEVATRTHYVQFTVPKKSGGQRTLSAPHRTLAAAQRWILDNVLNKLVADPAAHGFLSGRSILTNASPHVGRDVVINLDLEDFFPTITFRRARSVFQRLGYSGAVATILALLCTECPRRTARYDNRTYYVATGPRGLPQGACTSPALSNQVARRLDRRLTGLAKRLGLAYTRYADDLSFSGSLPLPVPPPKTPAAGDSDAKKDEGIGYFMARLRHIAEDEGFRINEKKSRVLHRSTAQMVTGVVVNAKPSIRRAEIRRLRAILHRARKEGLEAQNRQKRPNFRSWLEGKIAYVAMVRPDLGARLKAALSQVS